MQLYLDTANINEVREMARIGIIRGVTTNPSLMAKESGVTYKETVQELCSLVHGHISAEVIGLKAEEMVEEALAIAEWSPNAVVKIPMTEEGLAAISIINSRELRPATTCAGCQHSEACEDSEKGKASWDMPQIRTNCTLIFSTNQALLASQAGASYVSPFVGRLDDIGQDGMQMVAETVQMLDFYGIETEVIAASIRHPLHITQAAQAGAHIATCPYSVLKKAMNHPLTDAGIERFLLDWKNANIQKG